MVGQKKKELITIWSMRLQKYKGIDIFCFFIRLQKIFRKAEGQNKYWSVVKNEWPDLDKKDFPENSFILKSVSLL